MYLTPVYPRMTVLASRYLYRLLIPANLSSVPLQATSSQPCSAANPRSPTLDHTTSTNATCNGSQNVREIPKIKHCSERYVTFLELPAASATPAPPPPLSCRLDWMFQQEYRGTRDATTRTKDISGALLSFRLERKRRRSVQRSRSRKELKLGKGCPGT